MVTSNGESLVVQNIVRNGSLWSGVVFEKEVIFHEFDFETSDLEFEVSKSSIWKHTTPCDKGDFFLLLLSRNFDDRLSSNFHRFILCICWDTPSEETGLWQLSIVSSVFKRGDTEYKPHLWPQHSQMNTSPQKTERQCLHESIIRFKCFRIKKLLWRKSFLKVVYNINRCSASHHVSFYGHQFVK